jgi:serine/threonine-protein kinase
MRPNLVHDADSAARFGREASNAARIIHPNVAAVFDYGETEDGQPYLVMELVEGKTLAQLLGESALTLAQAVEIIRDVAEALGEAHRRGIVHRDIKPSNVALDERGKVKVLDFGLAKQLGGGHQAERDDQWLGDRGVLDLGGVRGGAQAEQVELGDLGELVDERLRAGQVQPGLQHPRRLRTLARREYGEHGCKHCCPP